MASSSPPFIINDLLCYLLQNFADFHEIVNSYSLVCKQWRSVSDLAISLINYPIELESGNLRRIFSDREIYEREHVPLLSSIKFVKINSLFAKQDVHKFATCQCFSKVKEIDVTCYSINYLQSFIKIFKNVQEISLVLRDKFDENYLKITKFPEMEKVKSLELEYSGSADDTSNQLMCEISKCKYFSNLKKLIWLGSVINSDGMEALCKSAFITKLETLHIIDDIGSAGDEDIKLMANSENFQHLTDLNLLENGGKFSSEALKHLGNGKYIKNLTSLEIGEFKHFIESPSFRKLKRFCCAHNLNSVALTLSQSEYLEELEDIQNIFYLNMFMKSDGLKALSMSNSIRNLSRLCLNLRSLSENEECSQHLMSSNFSNVRGLYGRFETNLLKSIAFSSAIRGLETIDCVACDVKDDFFKLLSHPKFCRLKKLVLQSETTKIDFSELKDCSFLVHIQRLELNDIQMGKEGLEVLFSGNNSKSLKYLSFLNCKLKPIDLNIISLSENLNSLEEMVIENNITSEEGTGISNLFESSNLINLKSLTLKRVGLIDSDLKLLANSSLGRKLRNLIIIDEDKISHIGLYWVMEKLTKLKSLKLEPNNFNEYSEAKILNFLSSFHNLNEIYVGYTGRHHSLKETVESMGIFYHKDGFKSTGVN
ncbi:predicted protein [Naegleria gruberi]|uniref:Predicted protein n=1 Tax=Naegleria gruberi TaxID=5762 RepID=D2VTD6_NAEGR|nr:uncharacterized protein NAEGRDRAFT_72262 [Naegleria gruberi]EFC39912.1 predicted protein [Naegleria gruberi]|eukprot:XP_002672656.1 predicted protein [Naegleria gruberi strain NEG-M]